jgi:glycine cleavage system P protein (glycine dehydrogenase) subunit 1
VNFAPHTDEEIAEMLSAIGAGSLGELFDQIPEAVRLTAPLDIPAGISEMELVADLQRLASRNRDLDQLVCFAGRGAYDHYVPSLVWALAGRSEFYTSYTPYQPELSQGVLQVLFEFQSMVCELTGLEVSNASLYDGATAVVEAVHMTVGAGRRKVLISDGVDPRVIETLRTYAGGGGFEPEVYRGDQPDVTPDVACVVVAYPDVYGALGQVRRHFGAAHDGGARAIQIFDPMSLGVLAPPGELGADIAVAEGQPLGNFLNYGGPYLGLIAARMDDVRRMPGRIVGETVDVDGTPGYVLTLQAREQHIRRDKANSNICTNQTLMAIAATIYLGWLGPAGLRELGVQCSSRAAYAAQRLTAIDGVSLATPDAPFFKEFALRLPRPPRAVVDRMVDLGFLAGVPLSTDEEEVLLVAVTERRTRAEIDGLADAMEEVLRS